MARPDVDHLGDAVLLLVRPGHRVEGSLGLRVCLYQDPGFRPVHPVQPGIDRGHEAPALVLLRVAAEVPDVAGLVLRQVVKRDLRDLSSVDLVVHHQHGSHAGDGSVGGGDGGRHLVGDRAAADPGRALAHRLHAGHQRKVSAAPASRIAEVRRVQLRIRDRAAGLTGLAADPQAASATLRQSNAASGAAVGRIRRRKGFCVGANPRSCMSGKSPDRR